jgi:RNA polymerase sigma-70 factor (ECF subfamily)
VLDRVLGREPVSTATIAVLHLHDGMTLQEVADAVGLSVSGVRKRLRKLKANLHELEEGI